MSDARIVVLGAGVGGTLVANRLARAGPPVDVCVVEGNGSHLYQPGLLHVPFGWRTPGRMERPHRRLLDDRVRLVSAGVRGIDVDRRRVETAAGESLPFDFLVVATGCRPAVRSVPGLREGGYHFHCPKRAVHLRQALDEFDAGHIVVGAAGLPYKCPPAPHEFAFLLDETLRRDGRRRHARITFVYPLPRVYPHPALAGHLETMLRERDISVEVPFTVESVEPEKRRVRSREGKTLSYDLLVLVPPHAGEPFLAEGGLGAGGGWVSADRHTLRVRERVYALGDATDLPVPKSGSAAHRQAGTVVRNVLDEIEGRPPSGRYDGGVT